MHPRSVQEDLLYMPRVVVSGAAAGAASRLSKTLADRMGVKWIGLQALDAETRRAGTPAHAGRRLDHELADPAWVVLDDRPEFRDRVWRRALALVWLDYTLGTVLLDRCGDAFRRLLPRRKNGSDDRSRTIGHRSVFRVRRHHFEYARRYPALLIRPEYAHLRMIRLASPRITARWLAADGSAPSSV